MTKRKGSDMTIRRTSRTFLALAASLFIAACGGGGGGGDDGDGDGGGDGGGDLDTTAASSTEIKRSNATTIGRAAGNGATAIGSAGSSTEAQFIGAADVDGAGSATSVGEATHFALNEILELSGEMPFAVSGVESSYSCDSGSATVSETDGDTDQLDTGDQWTAEWNDCEFSASTASGSFSTYLDGRIEFSVTECDNCGNVGDATADWRYRIEIEYTDWILRFSQDGTTQADMLIDGGLTFEADNDGSADIVTYTVEGGPWVFRDRLSGDGFGFGRLDMSHTVDRGSNTYSVTVNAMDLINPEMDGKVAVTTTTPLSGTVGQPPTAGVMEIDGASGSTATVDAGACSDSEFGLTVNGTDEGCKSWT